MSPQLADCSKGQSALFWNKIMNVLFLDEDRGNTNSKAFRGAIMSVDLVFVRVGVDSWEILKNRFTGPGETIITTDEMLKLVAQAKISSNHLYSG